MKASLKPTFFILLWRWLKKFQIPCSSFTLLTLWVHIFIQRGKSSPPCAFFQHRGAKKMLTLSNSNFPACRNKNPSKDELIKAWICTPPPYDNFVYTHNARAGAWNSSLLKIHPSLRNFCDSAEPTLIARAPRDGEGKRSGKLASLRKPNELISCKSIFAGWLHYCNTKKHANKEKRPLMTSRQFH